MGGQLRGDGTGQGGYVDFMSMLGGQKQLPSSGGADATPGYSEMSFAATPRAVAKPGGAQPWAGGWDNSPQRWGINRPPQAAAPGWSGNPETFVDQIAGSQEFSNQTQDLQNPANAQGFVDAAFRGLMDQAPKGDSAKQYLTSLQSHGDPSVMIRELMTSTAYQDLGKTPQQQIADLYQVFGRNPRKGEVDHLMFPEGRPQRVDHSYFNNPWGEQTDINTRFANLQQLAGERSTMEGDASVKSAALAEAARLKRVQEERDRLAQELKLLQTQMQFNPDLNSGSG